MPDLNRVTVTGNLTRDPELRDAGETKVCSLRIAVTGRRKVGDQWEDTPNYFDVSVWGKQGELAAEYLVKGRRVAVDGRLEWREWTKDDEKRQGVQIVADSLIYLGPPPEKDEPPAPARSRSGAAA